MQNIFTDKTISLFKKFIEDSCKISIISHVNPDGDAIGSSIGLKYILQSLYPEKQIRAFVPNNYPNFLSWIADNNIEICTSDNSDATQYILSSELIILSDLNMIDRTGQISDLINTNSKAKKIIMDHHETPFDADIVFHSNKASSTCLLVYQLTQSLGKSHIINETCASALLAGIITDTGGFSYSHLNKELFHAAGDLIEKGADPIKIHQQIYDTQTEDRLRLLGYLISEKMVVIPDKSAAYITISLKEKLRFNYQVGDTEGVVNYPMSIKEIKTSALFSENDDYIKISLRSQGDKINVDELAKKWFNGGGHFNAAGGKFFGTLQEAVETYRIALQEI